MNLLVRVENTSRGYYYRRLRVTVEQGFPFLDRPKCVPYPALLEMPPQLCPNGEGRKQLEEFIRLAIRNWEGALGRSARNITPPIPERRGDFYRPTPGKFSEVWTADVTFV